MSCIGWILKQELNLSLESRCKQQCGLVRGALPEHLRVSFWLSILFISPSTSNDSKSYLERYFSLLRATEPRKKETRMRVTLDGGNDMENKMRKKAAFLMVFLAVFSGYPRLPPEAGSWQSPGKTWLAYGRSARLATVCRLVLFWSSADTVVCCICSVRVALKNSQHPC